MDHTLRETGRTIKSRDMGNIHGVTAENTKANGNIISWTGTASANIKMGGCIMACIKIIKNTAMESTFGQTVENMMENGQMVSSMDQANR